MSRKLKIAMLIDAWFPFYGGGQVHVKNLTKLLKKNNNCNIELFYAGRSNILFRFFWSLIATFQVITHHKKRKFDLIHSHAHIAGLSGIILSKILKIPVIHTVHGSALLDQKTISPKAWLEKFLLTKIKYNAQITVSKNFLVHPNVNHNITIIPNGVDVSQFDRVKVKKSKNPRIIWVGRDDPVKGLKYLKTAILKVRKKIPHLETELVTGGRLTGKDLIAAYKRSHVFVLSSLAEGQPITLLEAWAAKLPVVVTLVGDNPDMVKNNINGILVEPANARQLADSILKILRSKKRAKQMGIEGHNLVKKYYSWENVANKTHQVYQSLLK